MIAGALSATLLSCSLVLGGDLDELSIGGGSVPLPDGPSGGSDAGSPEATLPTGPLRSCEDLPATAKSGVVEIDPDGAGPIPSFRAYCDLADPPRKWTLVLKIDGTTDNFRYGASLWTNDETLNPDRPDLDKQQAKLASFSTMAFTEIRVGMIDDDDVTRWVRVPRVGTSLRALFQGPAQTTTLGRDAWKGLMNSPRLQFNCNAEGFNVETMPRDVRVGLVANNESDCITTDSYIGFGGSALAYCSTSSACLGGPIEKPTFGYLMIR